MLSQGVLLPAAAAAAAAAAARCYCLCCCCCCCCCCCRMCALCCAVVCSAAAKWQGLPQLGPPRYPLACCHDFGTQWSSQSLSVYPHSSPLPRARRFPPRYHSFMESDDSNTGARKGINTAFDPGHLTQTKHGGHTGCLVGGNCRCCAALHTCVHYHIFCCCPMMMLRCSAVPHSLATR